MPNLGGALSLYMGATLIMSLEPVELAIDQGPDSIEKKILTKILTKILMKILTNFPSKSYNKKIMKKEFVHVSFSNLSS